MLSHNSSQVQFVIYSQFESPFHNLNITIYHTNLANLVQSTNNLYKNASHNMGNKIPQTISHLIVTIHHQMFTHISQINTCSTLHLYSISITIL